jgi:GTP-binding protein
MNLVAIVGRPNVGKSTFFNRLTTANNAIVEDIAGVTRDRIFGETDWSGIDFSVVDTGGFVPGSENVIEKAIREQAFIAIEDADVIIFVCDGRDGVTPYDLEITKILRSSDTPVVLAINKCDNEVQDNNAFEFFKLGLGTPFAISSANGHGTGDLLDEVIVHLKATEEEEEDDRLKIAIVGRPNVGKSSITNALAGEDRMIVTEIAGTTRDAIDSIIKYYGEEIVLIDTAGLRKRSHVKENIELYSIIRTARAIQKCDVACVVVDAERGLEEQDKRIIRQCDEARKGIFIAINKWDLIEKDTNTAKEFTEEIHRLMKTHDYIPVIFISAVTKQRINKIIDISKEIKVRRQNRISTSKLNETLLPDLERTPPPSVRARDLRINYVTQVNTEPPVFAFFGNHPDLIPDSYKRFMERRLRHHFDLEGTPVSFIFRKKNKRKDEA